MTYAIGMFVIMSCVCMWVYNYAYERGEREGYGLGVRHTKQRANGSLGGIVVGSRIACQPDPDWEEPYYLALGEQCDCPPGWHDPQE